MHSKVNGNVLQWISPYLSLPLTYLLFFFLLFSDTQIKAPHGVMVKELDSRIVVSESELQLLYYVHFWTNTLEKNHHHHHHHHHVVPPARISLTISRHFSLSFITSGRSSGLHPVSSHSCCM